VDYAGAWLRHQITVGEAALVLRQSGATWRQVAEQLRLADETHARRAVGLFLSADLDSRRAAQEATGEAQRAGVTDARAESQRGTGAAG
jgi:hypothetical protein